MTMASDGFLLKAETSMNRVRSSAEKSINLILTLYPAQADGRASKGPARRKRNREELRRSRESCGNFDGTKPPAAGLCLERRTDGKMVP
jgi:hypothetical protein